jgi:hypothetical protein
LILLGFCRLSCTDGGAIAFERESA